jgi:ankyrin repeat protein
MLKIRSQLIVGALVAASVLWNLSNCYGRPWDSMNKVGAFWPNASDAAERERRDRIAAAEREREAARRAEAVAVPSPRILGGFLNHGPLPFINRQDDEGNAPLHAVMTHVPLGMGFGNDRVPDFQDMISLLIAHGANPFLLNDAEQTPHQRQIARGANPGRRNDVGQRPRHMQIDWTEIARQLALIARQHAQRPRHMQIDWTEPRAPSIALLIEYGGILFRLTDVAQTPRQRQALQAELRDTVGRSIDGRCIPRLEALIARGADVTARYDQNQILLHMVTNAAVLEWLLDRGLGRLINHQDAAGNMPLHIAVRCVVNAMALAGENVPRLIAVVIMLLNRGANPLGLNNAEQTPRQMAMELLGEFFGEEAEQRGQELIYVLQAGEERFGTMPSGEAQAD